MDVSETDGLEGGEGSIQDLETDFWSNFPNLKLRIKSDYREHCVSFIYICSYYSECVILYLIFVLFFQPIARMINNICYECLKLESFVYEGRSSPDDCIKPNYPKVPSKEVDKFQNLGYIDIKFKVFKG